MRGSPDKQEVGPKKRAIISAQQAFTPQLCTSRYVLTAAHCHVPEKPERTIAEVVLGEHIVGQDPDCDTCEKVQRFVISPSDVTLHEDWDFSVYQNQGNDLALIRLPRLADILIFDTDSKDLVQPICLPLKSSDIDDSDSDLYITGWGKATQNRADRGEFATLGVFERTLNFAKLPFISHTECRRSLPVHRTRHICAGGEPGEFLSSKWPPKTFHSLFIMHQVWTVATAIAAGL